jgi:hypothetical protein
MCCVKIRNAAGSVTINFFRDPDMRSSTPRMDHSLEVGSGSVRLSRAAEIVGTLQIVPSFQERLGGFRFGKLRRHENTQSSATIRRKRAPD